MTKSRLIVMIIFVLLTVCTYAETKARIGIIYDRRDTINTIIGKKLVSEAEKITGKGKFEVIHEAYGNGSISGIIKAFDEMKIQNIDIVIAAGSDGSYAAQNINEYSQYIIAPFVYSRKTAALGNDKRYSIISDRDIKNEADILLSMTEEEKIYAVVTEKELQIMADEVDELKKYIGNKYKKELIIIAPDELNKNILVKGSAAILLGYEGADISGRGRLIKELSEKGVLILSDGGLSDVENGVLIGVDYFDETDIRIRKTAILLQRLIENEKADNEQYITTAKKLIINMDTAEKLGTAIPWAITEKAVKVKKEEHRKQLVFNEVIKKALNDNYEIKQAEKDKMIQAQETIKAASVFMPSVNTKFTGAIIDGDSAEAGMGAYKEQAVDGSLKVTQLIFSEKANLNFDIQKKIEQVRELEIKRKKADITAEISIMYLQALKASANIKIHKSILESAEKNLEISRNKAAGGIINQADVYRWEAESAMARAAAAKAEAQYTQIMKRIALTAGIDLKEEFITEDGEEVVKTAAPEAWRIGGLISDSGKCKKLMEFLVEKSVENAIELKMAESEKEIKKRYSEFAEKDRFMPQIAIQAEYKHKIYEGGKGEALDLSGLKALGIAPPVTKPAPKESWNIGIEVSFDVFDGGAKNAEYEKSLLDNGRSGMTVISAEEEIRESVISEYLNLETEYYNMVKSKEAETAAAKSYNIINEAYNKGQIPLSDILSVRNAKITAEQGAVLSKYDFLISLIKIERIAGIFSFSDSEKSKIFEEEIRKIIGGK